MADRDRLVETLRTALEDPMCDPWTVERIKQVIARAEQDTGDPQQVCPQCGSTPHATYYEHQYGVAHGVARHHGWPLGHQWAICIFGHRWVIAHDREKQP